MGLYCDSALFAFEHISWNFGVLLWIARFKDRL